MPACNEWNFEAGRQWTTSEQHISTTEARAGTTPHMTRYILGWGLALVIVAFVVLLFVWQLTPIFIDEATAPAGAAAASCRIATRGSVDGGRAAGTNWKTARGAGANGRRCPTTNSRTSSPR